MLSSAKQAKTILGMSVMALMAFSFISCGKKSSGGGGASAPPVCDVNGVCTVGQNYASGVYFRTAIGTASYVSNQNLIAKFAFYGKTAAGLNMNSNPVTYNGAFDVTGTVRVGVGAVATGVSALADRQVSNFNINLQAGYGLPQWQLNGSINGGIGTQGAYQINYGTGSGGSYYIPCGYYSTNCNGGGGYRPPTTGYPPGSYQPPYNQGNGNTACTIPAGDYTVTTVQSGNYTSQTGFSSETFTGLKIRFQSGANVVDATINTGYVYSSGVNSTTSHIMSGTMVVQTVNNQQCNQSIQFR